MSLIDGLVLARSAMHHSANYRSAMLLGAARPVEDARREARGARGDRRAHRARAAGPNVRPPTENELKATAVLALPIEEASAKVRTGPPIDDEEDYALPSGPGVIPLVAARRRARSPTRAWRRASRCRPTCRDYRRAAAGA